MCCLPFASASLLCASVSSAAISSPIAIGSKFDRTAGSFVIAVPCAWAQPGRIGDTPEAFGECGVTNDPKADGGNSGPEKAAGAPLQDQGGKHQQKAGTKCDDERPLASIKVAPANQQPFRSDRIEEFAPR
jgi:hypothetical protein